MVRLKTERKPFVCYKSSKIYQVERSLSWVLWMRFECKNLLYEIVLMRERNCLMILYYAWVPSYLICIVGILATAPVIMIFFN